MNQLAKLFIKLSLDSSQFTKDLKGLSSIVTPRAVGIGNSIMKGIGGVVRKGMRLLGLSMLAILAASFAAGIGSLNIASKFEQEFAKVNAIMAESEQVTSELRSSILSMGLDPNFKVSTLEANEAVLVLAKNGVSASNIVGGALEASIALANATTQEFGKSADVATDLVNIFGLENDKLKESINGVVGTINNSKFSLNDYRLALGQAGAVADATGLSVDDFNTIIAGTASNFTSGSDAGTSFKVFLQRMVPQTNQAKDALERLGLLTEDTTRLTQVLAEQMGTATPKQLDKYHAALELGKSDQEALRSLMGKTKSEFLNFALTSGIVESAIFDMNGSFKGGAELARKLALGFGDLNGEQEQLLILTEAFGTDAIKMARGLAALGEAIPDQSKLNEFANGVGFTLDELRAFDRLSIDDQMEALRVQLGQTEDQFNATGLEAGFLTNKYGELADKIGNTDAFKLAFTQVDNVRDVFSILKEQIVEVGRSIGATVLPAFKLFGRASSSLIDIALKPLIGASEIVRRVMKESFDGIESDLRDNGLRSVLENLGVGDFFLDSLDIIEDWGDRVNGVLASFSAIMKEDVNSELSIFDKLMFALRANEEFGVIDGIERIRDALAEIKAGNYHEAFQSLGFKDEDIARMQIVRDDILSIAESLKELFTIESDQSILSSIAEGLRWLVDNKETVKEWTTNVALLTAGFVAFSIAVSIVTGLITIATAAMTLWGIVSALAMSPIIIAIAVVLAVFAVFTIMLRELGFTWEDVWNGVLYIWNEIVKPIWDELYYLVVDFQWRWQLFTDQVRIAWQVLGEDLRAVWEETIMVAFEAMRAWFMEKLPNAIAIFGAKFHLMLNTIRTNLILWWNQDVLRIFNLIKTWLTVTIPGAFTSFVESASQSLGTVGEKFDALKTKIRGVINTFLEWLGLGGSSMETSFTMNHTNPNDTLANSPMRIHTRVADFADYLKGLNLQLNLGSGGDGALSTVSSGIEATRSNLKALKADLGSSLSDVGNNIANGSSSVVNNNIFEDGAVTVQLSREEFDGDEDFADFVVGRAGG